KDYSVPAGEIVMENPKAMEGISAGDTLRIPLPTVTAAPKTNVDTTADKQTGKYIYHKVVAKETLYSLGKQYGVSINTLDSLNPELKSKGLIVGQNLKIPAHAAPQQQTKPEVIIQPKPEVLYMAPPKTMHDSTKEKKAFQNLVSHQHIDSVKNVKGITAPNVGTPINNGPNIGAPLTGVDKTKLLSRYNVALIMPFNSENADTLRLSRLLDGTETLPLYTQISTDFYQGAMIALDSLEKQGIRVNLHLYNISSTSDTSAYLLDSILKAPGFASTNLIIGPPSTAHFKQVARYAAKHGIPIVSPIVADNSVLQNNAFASKVTPSSLTEVENMADYIAAHYDRSNIILLHHRDATDEVYYENFKKRFKADMEVSNEKDSVTTADYSDNLEILGKKINEYKNNVIVAPYQGASFVAKLVNKLANSKYADNDSIVLFGMHSWLNNDNLDMSNLDTLNFHFPSNDFVNYSDSCTKGFIKSYRWNYYTEPSNFACQGFDVTYFYVKLLGKYGTALQDHLSDVKYNGVHTSFDLRRVNDTGGYDNKAIYILEYRSYALLKGTL
ncbi:MAG TPA: ABC transporter substrate-binding protein, partial [Bacteroidia bacterium]|nr:ABC transporter substrate-binding protein [Bacteroidia bacterium]